jgi:hypothetical protein
MAAAVLRPLFEDDCDREAHLRSRGHRHHRAGGGWLRQGPLRWRFPDHKTSARGRSSGCCSTKGIEDQAELATRAERTLATGRYDELRTAQRDARPGRAGMRRATIRAGVSTKEQGLELGGNCRANAITSSTRPDEYPPGPAC